MESTLVNSGETRNMESTLVNVEEQIKQAIGDHSLNTLAQTYREQGEFLTIDGFVDQSVVECFLSDVEKVRSQLNRNYIPGHKKGGSISYYILRQGAPSIVSFYQDSALIDWLGRIAGAPLLLCPEGDPHSCALYFYTQPGDHIGFHYDTSYYKGARYTALLGLVDRSTSQLVCRLHTKDPSKGTKEISMATKPGSLIFFNGDLLHHAVTPLGENEERIVLTLQYVTNPEMGPLKRWFSNMKDAVGYFGLPALFRRPGR